MENMKNLINKFELINLKFTINNVEVPIETDWVKYIIVWYFDLEYDNDNDNFSFVWDLYDLIVIQDWKKYSFSNFYQSYDEISNGYKNHKDLTSKITNQIEKYFNWMK
jgi:hypothetical protein